MKTLTKEDFPRANNYGVPQSAFEGICKLIFGWGIPTLIFIWVSDIYNIFGWEFVSFAVYKNLIMAIVLSLGLFFISVSSRGMKMEQDELDKIISQKDKTYAILEIIQNTDIPFAERKEMLDNEFMVFGTFSSSVYADALKNLKRGEWEK